MDLLKKTCAKCKEEKVVSEFHKSTRDGYRSRCKVCKREDDAIYRKENSEIDKSSKKKWRDNNKEYMINYYLTNKHEITLYNKSYYMEHKEDIINKTKEYKKHYNIVNPHIIAHRAIINRFMRWIKSKKLNRTHILLGYTAEELKNRIEAQFKEGMSWENWGEWHIDHIKPISKFEKTELPSVVNSLDNLQPLWAFENLTKGNRYE